MVKNALKEIKIHYFCNFNSTISAQARDAVSIVRADYVCILTSPEEATVRIPSATGGGDGSRRIRQTEEGRGGGFNPPGNSYPAHF